MPLGLLGKKLGHTRVYDAQGVMTPVTIVLAGPNRVLQVREADNLLLIKGSFPGSEGDYVVIRESKKRPKGWKPPVSIASGKKAKAAEKAAEPKKAEAKK